MTVFGDKHQPEMRHYQQEFLETFINAPAPQRFILEAEVGMGAQYTACRTVQEFLSSQKGRSVLWIAPKALLEQTQAQLAAGRFRADLLDCYRLRELNVDNDQILPQLNDGSVYLLTPEFAKQKDVFAFLKKYHWDLIIVTEGQRIEHAFASTLAEIQSVCPESSALILTQFSAEKSVRYLGQYQIVRWNRSDMLDRHKRAPILLKVIPYARSLDEQPFEDRFLSLLGLLTERSKTGAKFANLLIKQFRSSPAAAEEALRAMKNRNIYEVPNHYLEVTSNNPATDDESSLNMDFKDFNCALLDSDIQTCLDALDDTSVDSKMRAFTEALLNTKQTDRRRLCVLTEYRATLFYLQSEIYEIGFEPLALHGAMSYSDRASSIRRFSEHGGILLSTLAMTPGLDFTEFDAVFLYDLTESDRVLEQICARLVRFGRKSPLQFFTLVERVQIAQQETRLTRTLAKFGQVIMS